jgi:hypothetical protein
MKRWPLIRHLRYVWLAYCFNRWWYTIGRHIWLAPNAADERYLDDVWYGRR